jgi:hypothetical protein
MEEARTIIRRLGRIETLRNGDAPAETVLGELRHLLREGEAWLAAERNGGGEHGGSASPGGDDDATTEAAAALAACRARLNGGEVMPESSRGSAL